MGELLEKKRKRVVEGPKGRIQKGSISRKNTIKGSKSFHSEISMISKTKMVAIIFLWMHLCSNSNQWQKLPILSSQSPYLPGCLFYFLWTLNLKSYTWNELDLLNKQKIPLVTFSVINITGSLVLMVFSIGCQKCKPYHHNVPPLLPLVRSEWLLGPISTFLFCWMSILQFLDLLERLLYEWFRQS